MRTYRWWHTCVLVVLGPVAGAVLAYAAEREPETLGTLGPTAQDVSPAQLQSMFENKDFQLVNVHIPYEGEIEGTDLFIPFDAVEANLGKLPAHKEAKLVVYCRSGRMRARGALLESSGGHRGGSQGPSNLSYLPFAREGALGVPGGEVYLTDQVKDLLLGETAR